MGASKAGSSAAGARCRTFSSSAVSVPLASLSSRLNIARTRPGGFDLSIGVAPSTGTATATATGGASLLMLAEAMAVATAVSAMLKKLEFDAALAYRISLPGVIA